MKPMETTGYPNGGNSPYTAALATQQSNAAKANQLANIGGRRRRKRKSKFRKSRKSRKSRRKRRGGTIIVPTVQTLYTDKGVGDQSVNGNITANTKISANLSEQSKYDSCIGQPASCTTKIS
jgi:hypothetical protein